MKQKLTEEERKAAKKEYNKQYYQKNKEKFAEYNADYYQNNKEKFAEYYQNHKKTIAKRRQSNKEKKAEYDADYYQSNKEKFADYYQRNKEKLAKYNAEYYAKYLLTPKGRALNLLKDYRRRDKKQNKGECTLTADWIVEHIFSQPCHYCGRTGWTKMGCDRIDNSLPHVPDNVVPCCAECNTKRGATPYDEYMKMIGK